MKEQTAIKPIGNLPSGAVFYRCALQVNPHHYGETYRGQPSELDKAAYADALIAKAEELGISVLGITDHNHVGGISSIRCRAEACGIHVFPGFELASSEGVHVLCLYPCEMGEETLGRYLGSFGIHETEPSTALSDKRFSEILALVRQHGGVPIAAHVTNKNGLFRVLEGQARIQAWQDENLLAVQIPGPVTDLPQDVRPIVQNKNPDYRREHPAGNDLAVAAVNARDVVQPGDLEDAAATCWIKMSEIGIEGLRQAFLDPGSRIRLASDPQPEEHAELVALSWEGGFLDGMAIHLNPNLNVLVGGRGTGKSTVIESLRYALSLEPLGENARKAHEGIVRHVLRSGTKISLLVRSYRPAKREYRIERTVPNPPVVPEESGRISNLLPEEILPRTELYGQHEISELTRSKEKLTRLLDRFVEPDEGLDRRKADLRLKLGKYRREISDVRTELQGIEDRLAALPGLEETLKRFQEAGLEDRLREQSLIVKEDRILQTAGERLMPFLECLETLPGSLPIDRAFLSSKALEDLPGRGILEEADAVLVKLNLDLERIAADLEAALQTAETGLSDIRTKWGKRKNEVREGYQAILRELQKSRIDGEEFIRLQRRIEELRPLEERRSLLLRLAGEYCKQRQDLLAEWEDAKAEEFRLLDRAANKVSQKLRGRVRVAVRASADRQPLISLLRELGGRLSEAVAQLEQAEEISLPHFVECCRKGAETLSQEYEIPLAQADRLAKAPPETLMRIEELELPPTTQIELNTASGNEPEAWNKLDDLSTGQKATAVLLLLLLESDAPLIVDQPEDDLDNRFITEGVVPRMREEKRRRQFIFSTHNANIPVLGDAELIVGLSASGEAERGSARIPTRHMGSIDSKAVCELVEEILEGGKEAFERRRLKYGF